ncbi:zinc-binding dehydrogenase, partial [Actinomadura kijaniata]|uniref:zinc-binding dehydrogenase n=1 Tax=Actinomadura kijaniata TaxID=46161 RepID=UPI003F1DE2BA
LTTSGASSPVSPRCGCSASSSSGSTMGTRTQLERLANFLVKTGVRPHIDRVLPLSRAAEGFAAMHEGDLFGKIVFTP